MPLPKPPGCTGCPAASVGRGYVPPRGPADAERLLMGQGPGETEFYQGEPFVGPAGQKLERWLIRSGWSPLKVRFDNVVRCWLPKNREPHVKEVEWCRRAHWGPDLEAQSPKGVVAVGLAATKAFMGPKVNESALGAPIMYDTEEQGDA